MVEIRLMFSGGGLDTFNLSQSQKTPTNNLQGH